MTAIPLICLLAFIFCVVVGVVLTAPKPPKWRSYRTTQPRPDPPKGQGFQCKQTNRNVRKAKEAVEEVRNRSTFERPGEPPPPPRTIYHPQDAVDSLLGPNITVHLHRFYFKGEDI